MQQSKWSDVQGEIPGERKIVCLEKCIVKNNYSSPLPKIDQTRVETVDQIVGNSWKKNIYKKSHV